jgi:hypothetical protein
MPVDWLRSINAVPPPPGNTIVPVSLMSVDGSDTGCVVAPSEEAISSDSARD